MPREKENFREILARLQENYPGREALTGTEVADMMGCDIRTLATAGVPRVKMGRCWRYPMIPLARWLA